MNEKNIELELRAEVLPQDQESIKNKIAELGALHSHTKRLSVMYFGSVGTKKIDIRIRITNGECEIVVKSGSFGSHDRIEIAQKIDIAQFLGLVKILAQLNFVMEIGERETFNYELPDEIVVSFVSAGPIAYIELEKISSRSDLDQNNAKLHELANRLKLQLLDSDKEFDSLCKRLTEKVDWPFSGTKEDYEKLIGLINRYTN